MACRTRGRGSPRDAHRRSSRVTGRHCRQWQVAERHGTIRDGCTRQARRPADHLPRCRAPLGRAGWTTGRQTALVAHLDFRQLLTRRSRSARRLRRVLPLQLTTTRGASQPAGSSLQLCLVLCACAERQRHRVAHNRVRARSAVRGCGACPCAGRLTPLACHATFTSMASRQDRDLLTYSCSRGGPYGHGEGGR